MDTLQEYKHDKCMLYPYSVWLAERIAQLRPGRLIAVQYPTGGLKLFYSGEQGCVMITYHNILESEYPIMKRS